MPVFPYQCQIIVIVKCFKDSFVLLVGTISLSAPRVLHQAAQVTLHCACASTKRKNNYTKVVVFITYVFVARNNSTVS